MAARGQRTLSKDDEQGAARASFHICPEKLPVLAKMGVLLVRPSLTISSDMPSPWNELRG
ncbi:hypothetical protein BON30_45190 [Cystobacter ferrugineus]|uniref:Uncharacterized protein n=1 Tax=Cystobacter ferrugineus TaxID=83449 RepID=A0A1L9AVZ3_9BACT|nr:hypothetical protein BON30_45190 [Cystobacter ferrugineus]